MGTLFDDIGDAIVAAFRAPESVELLSTIGATGVVYVGDPDFENFPSFLNTGTNEVVVMPTGEGGTNPVTAATPGLILRQGYAVIVTSDTPRPADANLIKLGLVRALARRGHTLGLGAKGVLSWEYTWRDLLSVETATPGEDAEERLRFQNFGGVIVAFRDYNSGFNPRGT